MGYFRDAEGGGWIPVRLVTVLVERSRQSNGMRESHYRADLRQRRGSVSVPGGRMSGERASTPLRLLLGRAGMRGAAPESLAPRPADELAVAILRPQQLPAA